MLNELVPILWTLFGVIIIGFYNGLMILDDKTPENDPKNKTIEYNWHIVGAILFTYISITAWNVWGVKYVPFVLSCFWGLFAGIVHRVGLDRPFFFVGTTAVTDRWLRNLFPKNFVLASAILKILALLISIIIIVLK